MSNVCKSKVWVHVDKSCIAGNIGVLPFLRKKHLPAVVQVSVCSGVLWLGVETY